MIRAISISAYWLACRGGCLGVVAKCQGMIGQYKGYTKGFYKQGIVLGVLVGIKGSLGAL